MVDEPLEVLILKYNLTIDDLFDEMQDFTLINLLEKLLEGIFELPHEYLLMVIEGSFMHNDEDHENDEMCKPLQEMQLNQIVMGGIYFLVLVQQIEYE